MSLVVADRTDRNRLFLDRVDQPVLRVSGLRTSFLVDGVWQPVVRDVSFAISSNETLALVGESGSGKSVTALSIQRLIDPRLSLVEGHVYLADTDLLTLRAPEMQAIRGRDIGMIFQEPMTCLNPVMTVGYQISETLRRHRGMTRAEARLEAQRLLDRVRIPSARRRLSDYPHHLSGGMRQRIMIAMALACRPRLLIADEPTTALDVTIQAQILELIKLLQSEDGMSVLFITHDMGVVAEIADRTVVMYQGEAVEAGATEVIFHHCRHPYTKALMAAVPRLGSMRTEPLPLRFPRIDLKTGLVQPPETPSPSEVTRSEGPLLEVRNLTTRFDVRGGFFRSIIGRVHAVENVSFDLGTAETLSVVGESGCGKSTTGRSILRLVEPDRGTVRIDGVNLLELDAEAMRARRASLQMVFQDPAASLNPKRRVHQIIADPLIANGHCDRDEAFARVADALERVGLQPRMMDRYPHEFSGGQRQRICIARTLVMKPKVIVADEAVSALDVSIKAQVVNLMLDLQQALGISYLFISHDMAIVERVSHRVAVMYLGEIVEIGPRAAVFGNPGHAYTRQLISAVPIPDPKQRSARRGLSADELRSPIRPVEYVPVQRKYDEIGPGHFVQCT